MLTLAEISKQADTLPEVQTLLSHLTDVPSDSEAALLYVPGRIELLGKHVDYGGGRSLTCASSRGFSAVCIRTDRPGLQMTDDLVNEDIFIPYSASSRQQILERGGRLPGWRSYPEAVVRRVTGHFGTPDTGVWVIFRSNLPRAAGLSSSSALLTLSFLALATMDEFAESDPFQKVIRSREDLADFLGAVESGGAYRDLDGQKGVGTTGGSQDHAAILCSSAGVVNVFDYRPVRRVESLTFPAEYVLAIAVSGVHADKRTRARQSYNRLSQLAARIGEGWQARKQGERLAADDCLSADPGTLAATIEDPDADESLVIDLIDEIADSPDDRERLWHRFAQFHDETTIVVPGAIEAWKDQDWARFGELADRSQEMAEEWLGNQVPQTGYLARSARDMGALAASSFGAGFGGAVWALLPADTAADFARRWIEDYRGKFPDLSERADVFLDRPSSGAKWLAG